MEHNDLSVKAEIRLYYDLFIPDELVTPAPLLITVHGYGAHKRYMMREAKAVGGTRFVIASIQAPHPHYRSTAEGYRIGYGWLAGDERSAEHVKLHHRFVLDVIERTAADGMVDPHRVFMYGFSQACALNFRFAFTYPDRLRAIIGVCGGIPSDLDTNPAYSAFSADTLYLYGSEDEFYSQEQFAGFDAKLRETLPNYGSKHYSGGHEITEEMREDIRDFLTQAAD